MWEDFGAHQKVICGSFLDESEWQFEISMSTISSIDRIKFYIYSLSYCNLHNLLSLSLSMTTTMFPPSEPRSHWPSCEEVVGLERALRCHPVHFYVDCLFGQLAPCHFSHLLATLLPLHCHSANLDLLKSGHSRALEALSLLFPNHYIVARCLSLSLSLPSRHHVQWWCLLLLYIIYNVYY